MNIGLLKEIKQDERRVALQPIQAKALSREGHNVYVELGAGEGAGFSDADYRACGANVMPKDEILIRARLLLKIKAPLRSEYADYAPHHILFTYLHFDGNPPRQDVSELISRGFLGIAYEWVGSAGQYPLLEPMSQLSGYLFAQKSLELCLQENGVFCPRNEKFLPGGQALIIGCGNIGLSAFKYLSDLGVALTVVVNGGRGEFNSKANARFGTEGIDYISRNGTNLIVMDNEDPSRTRERIVTNLPKTDIVLNCAVRRPGLPKWRMEYLIDRSMVRAMNRGGIICDCTASDRDMIETCVSTEPLDHSYREEGVVHYNCDHIPSLVAHTATRLLTASTFSYIRCIANLESVASVTEHENLRNGVCCYDGHLTHAVTAEKKGLPYRPLIEVIEAS